MKISIPFCIVASLVLAVASAVSGAEKKKRGPTPPTVDAEAVALIKPWDKDGNYEIDKDELKAMDAAYKKDPSGPLKSLDLSHDGSLDDTDRLNMNNKLGAA